MKNFLIMLLFLITIIPTSSFITTPPQTIKSNDVWNVNTLKIYFDTRLDAMQMAVTKAEQATEKRFEGVNEFRLSLDDLTRTMMPRSEVEEMIRNVNKRIDETNQNIEKIKEEIMIEIHKNNTSIEAIQSTKQGGKDMWIYVVSIGAFIASLFAIYKNNIFK